MIMSAGAQKLAWNSLVLHFKSAMLLSACDMGRCIRCTRHILPTSVVLNEKDLDTTLFRKIFPKQRYDPLQFALQGYSR